MTALAAVMTAEQTGWCGFFTSFENSHEGFVDSKKQLDELVWRFAAETKSCFTSVKTSTNFGNTDITKKQHKVQWCDKQELPDHPYIVVHTERFECHHGPDRNKSKKEKAKTNQEGDHHTYQKRRYHTQKTKKLGCPAAIVAKEIIFFTEYKGSVSKYKREQISKEIRKKIGEGDLPQFQRKILVKLPTKHENHLPGEVAEISLPVDKRVTSKVEEYVSEGFTSSSCIRSLIELFVRNELFVGQKCPSWIDRRFFPTQRDISNAIYSAKMKAMKSKYDQENLQAHIDYWAKERPEDSFSFSATEVNSENVEETSGGFFFLYQSSWQKRLLNLYGNELCLLDATYRTTKYAIPLFFLCVKTNVDYSVVAVFACQSENSHTIAKALRLIKEWNPNWNPKHFMTDLCEAELNAIATCFPDCHSFICDFHREQAWGRWLKASKHGLNKNKDDILPLLRRIARASSQTDFDQAISNLMENRFWEQQKDFRDWFTNTWLKNVQKWAWVYRQDRLLVNINTNNGVERQNRTLKYDFLSKYTDRTLTGMLTTVIKRFLPDQYRKYLDVNIKASGYYRRYNENLPLFLHNRPKEFIDHCRKRLSSAEEVEGKIEVGDGMFTVQSFTDPYSTYVVTLGTETDVPSCQCHDWLHSHWPCKHMLAVVMHYPGNSWDDLAAHYRNNVMFVLDHLCVEDIGFKVSSGNQLIPDSDESIDYVDGESTVVTPGTEDISIKTEEVESKDLLAVIREELEHIKALTYLEVPVSVQTKVLEELTMVRVILNEAVPSEHQLPLLHSKETVKSSGKAPFNIIKRKSKPALRKASTVRRKFKELPSRRKRKVAVKRGNINVPDHMSIMDDLISGATYLEEPSNLDGLCRKKGPATEHEAFKDQCNPMKKMKLSSPVTESSPGNEQDPQHIKESETEELISGTLHLLKPTDQAGNKLKLNFRRQWPSSKSNSRVVRHVKTTRTEKKQNAVKKIRILPQFKEHIKQFDTQLWEDKIAKSRNKYGVSGKRAGGVLEMAEDEPEELINAIVSCLPYPLKEDALVSVLFQVLADMVDTGKIKLDIDPKQTEKECDKAMKDLISFIKESSGVKSVSQQNADKGLVLPKRSSEALSDECSANVEGYFITQLTTSGLMKSSNYMVTRNKNVRYSVCKEVLEGKDLKTLQGSNWLNDKVINTFMSILQQEQNANNFDHIYVIPSYMAVLWENNEFETWFYKKVQFSNYKWIFMPINKNGNHWILLVANVPEKTVSILDSLPGNNARYIQYWRKYMKKRYEAVGDVNFSWKIGTLASSYQKDGHSCGPFVLMNAMALTKGIVPSMLTQRVAPIMRQYVTNKIILCATKPAAQLTVCDMVDCKKPGGSWVQCTVCGRWLHFECINLQKKPEGDFVCMICHAQYE